MAFRADDATLVALLPEEFSRVMMGTPKDGKVAIAKFGLIAEDNNGKAGKTAEGERAIWILKQRRTVYPEHVGTAISKVWCFGHMPIVYFVRCFGNGSRPLAINVREEGVIGHFIVGHVGSVL